MSECEYSILLNQTEAFIMEITLYNVNLFKKKTIETELNYVCWQNSKVVAVAMAVTVIGKKIFIFVYWCSGWMMLTFYFTVTF